MNETGIVADGRSNLLAASDNQQKVAAAVQELEQRYAERMKMAGPAARLRLWFRKRRELQAAIESIAPSSACYAKQ